jgi:hypothetical protein
MMSNINGFDCQLQNICLTTQKREFDQRQLRLDKSDKLKSASPYHFVDALIPTRQGVNSIVVALLLKRECAPELDFVR